MTLHRFESMDGGPSVDERLAFAEAQKYYHPLVMNPGDYVDAKAVYPNLEAENVFGATFPAAGYGRMADGQWDPLDDRVESTLADLQRRDLIADSAGYPAVVGLDLSLTGTGVVVHQGAVLGSAVHLIKSDPADYRSARDAKDKPVATYADRMARLEDVLAEIEARIPTGSLVFLEAPSYGSNTSGTFDRSGLWWLTYQRLTALSCRVIPVAPAQRMLYATGKGRADKDQVLAAVVTRYPGLGVTNNNTADAAVLMAMAARASGSPVEESMPAANLRAMDKLEAL